MAASPASSYYRFYSPWLGSILQVLPLLTGNLGRVAG